MNRGLMSKTVHEVWPTTLLFGLALATFEAMLVYVVPNIFGEQAEVLFQMEFMQRFIKGLLGTDFSGAVGPELFKTFAWAHPLVLAMLWAHEIMFITRMPAGEIDRGTADVLLSLPVSRTTVYVSETVVWIGSGMTVLSMGLMGNVAADWLGRPDAHAPIGRVLVVVLNLSCVYLAVGGVAWLVSSLSNVRGRAVGVMFSLVLASFFVNFLAELWAPARSISVLSVLHYYRPHEILANSALPVMDMTVLSLVGFTAWLAGAVVFARRDICTV